MRGSRKSQKWRCNMSKAPVQEGGWASLKSKAKLNVSEQRALDGDWAQAQPQPRLSARERSASEEFSCSPLHTVHHTPLHRENFKLQQHCTPHDRALRRVWRAAAASVGIWRNLITDSNWVTRPPWEGGEALSNNCQNNDLLSVNWYLIVINTTILGGEFNSPILIDCSPTK